MGKGDIVGQYAVTRSGRRVEILSLEVEEDLGDLTTRGEWRPKPPQPQTATIILNDGLSASGTRSQFLMPAHGIRVDRAPVSPDPKLAHLGDILLYHLEDYF